MVLALVVDDQVINQAIYAKLVCAAIPDARVQCFSKPQLALQWLSVSDPDLIITDYRMPRMSGAAFIKRLRSLDVFTSVPIIAITAYGDRASKLRSLRAGASDFLDSPVDHAEFISRVQNANRVSRQHRETREMATLLRRTLVHSRPAPPQTDRGDTVQLSEAFDAVPAFVLATNRDGFCTFVNKQLSEITGSIQPDAASSSQWFGSRRKAISRTLDTLVIELGRPLPAFEEDVVTAVGEVITLLTTKEPIYDADSKILGVLTTSVIVTNRTQAEPSVPFPGHYDHLTQLPNRSALERRLRAEAEAAHPVGRQLALFVVEMLQGKEFVETFGRNAADQVLRDLAVRLARSRPARSTYKIGEERFCILVPGPTHTSRLNSVAKAIVQSFDRPIFIGERSISVRCAVGIAVAPHDGRTADELLHNAELALNRAKLSGTSSVRRFTAHLLTEANAKAAVFAALDRALPLGQFVLHYQPQVSFRTGAIVGAEALLRWCHPDLGLLSPGDFLPAAERCGIMLELSAWALNEACRQAVKWQSTLGSPLSVAVNLAQTQIQSRKLFAQVTDALRLSGLPPNQLELEITEEVVFGRDSLAALQIDQLRTVGVKLSVDDFGTGYSSLSRLLQLRVDRLKIDRSLTLDVAEGSRGLAVIRAVIALSRALDLEIVAEGIESAESASRLSREGCDVAQGFFFGRPMSGADFYDFVQARRLCA